MIEAAHICKHGRSHQGLSAYQLSALDFAGDRRQQSPWLSVDGTDIQADCTPPCKAKAVSREGASACAACTRPEMSKGLQILEIDSGGICM